VGVERMGKKLDLKWESVVELAENPNPQTGKGKSRAHPKCLGVCLEAQYLLAV
jgi:hypothetical protein